MAWQDVANARLQGHAPTVIDILSNISPDYDWSRAIEAHATEGETGGDSGWFDTNRNAPASVAWGLLSKAAAFDPANASAINSARDGNVNAMREQAVSQIQQQQAKNGGGGLFGGGGFLGLGDLGMPLLAAGSFFGAPMLAGALGGGLGGSLGAGALIGGGGSFLGGGDPFKGSLLGAGGAGLGAAFNSGFTPDAGYGSWNDFPVSGMEGGAAPSWLSNVPSGSVMSPGGMPFGLGADLGSNVGTNMVTTGGSAPWYSGIGANSGFGPLATGGGENMGLTAPNYGGGAPAPTPSVSSPSPVVTGDKSIFEKGKEVAKEIAPYAPLLGAGAGLLGGGNKPAGSITIEEGIPDWLKGYMKPALDKYSTDIQNYQTDPYGIMPGAMQEFKNTISGQYLDPSTNKYLEDYFRMGSERVKGTLSPSFGHMQAFGSNTGYNEALSKGLGDLAVGLYGGAYEKERDRQSQAIGAAPSFLQNASTAQFAPYQNYLSTVGGLGKKKEEPYFDQSALSKMFGGALAGYSLGNIFK